MDKQPYGWMIIITIFIYLCTIVNLIKMSEVMKVVDGEMMVSALQTLVHKPLLASDEETDMLLVEIARKQGLVNKYSMANLIALTDKTRSEISGLREEITKSEIEEILEDWRMKGYVIIRTPNWQNELTNRETGFNFNIPYIITSTNRKWAIHGDYQALYQVPIQNWIGDMPEFIVDKAIEFRNAFKQLAIMFVARRSKVKELVSNFVKQDPVLIGVVNKDYSVVLDMWDVVDEELKQISLLTIDPELENVDKSNL